MYSKYLFNIILILIFIYYFINIYFYKKETFSNLIKLNNIVDKIYIINLEKDKYRLDILKPKLHKFKIKYKIIEGIDGNNVVNNTKLRNGQYGCLLSHKKILEDALKNNYNQIAIFEDDIIFNRNFNTLFDKKYKYLINKEKDYDILYIGSSQGYYQYKKKKWNNITINKHYYKVKDTLGAFAFIINKKVIKKILEELDKQILPIDTLIKRKIIKNKNYNCFALFPNIITTNVSNMSNTSYKQRNQEYYLKLNNLNSKDFDF